MIVSQAEAVLWLGLEVTAITAADLLVGLFKGNLAPDPLTTLAVLALAEPTGSWYTRAAATVGEVFLNPDGSLQVAFESVEFDYTGSDPAEVITGYFVVTALVPRLVGLRSITPGKSMGNSLDSLIVQPSIRLPQILAA